MQIAQSFVEEIVEIVHSAEKPAMGTMNGRFKNDPHLFIIP